MYDCVFPTRTAVSFFTIKLISCQLMVCMVRLLGHMTSVFETHAEIWSGAGTMGAAGSQKERVLH